MRFVSLLLCVLAQISSAVTISYTARVENGAPGYGIGLADFLNHYGRGTIATPGGNPGDMDILFEGSFAFTYPQTNQNCGGSVNCKFGTYDLGQFAINGQTLQKPSGFSYQEIFLVNDPLGDSYQVVFANLIFPSLSDGKQRTLELALELSLPASTFGTGALPPDISFFSKATNYTSGQAFNYRVFDQNNSLLGGFGGHTVWTSADSDLDPVPEPTTFGMLTAGVAGLLLRAVTSHRRCASSQIMSSLQCDVWRAGAGKVGQVRPSSSVPAGKSSGRSYVATGGQEESRS